jgi:hypothetical protein
VVALLGRSCLAPAGNGAIPHHPAGVVVTRTDRGEIPQRRGGFAPSVLAPAGDGAVPLDTAGVVAPGTDGDELPLRRRVSTPPIPPADDGAVPLHRAGMFLPGTYSGEPPLRWRIDPLPLLLVRLFDKVLPHLARTNELGQQAVVAPFMADPPSNDRRMNLRLRREVNDSHGTHSI